MAQTKPQQFVPAPSGDQALDKVQDVLRQTTEAVRNGPPNQTTVKSIVKNKPDQGIVFRPGQTVDIPHNLGRVPNGFNIGKVLTNTQLASSAPAAVPNLQIVAVPGPLGQQIMRLRYIAPK
ncbi:MAG: hypothetical protein EBR82_83570, partial [Caulobacteraceae bacterium]|nr:hypothetical protein [Caulobacteraceae bacterium]